MNALYCYGETAQERIIWMSLFVQGLNGRRGIPYILVGPPGTQKTSFCARVARRAGLRFEPVVVSSRAPQDFLGVPVPSTMSTVGAPRHVDPDFVGETTYAHYAPFGFGLRAAMAPNGSLVLIDEANTGMPDTQSALLRVVLERVMGELDLGPRTRMTLAMNASKHTASSYELAAAMTNRIGFLDWEGVSAKQFCAYVLSKGGADPLSLIEPIDTMAFEAEVDAHWGRAWATAAGQIAGFITSKPSALMQEPREGHQGAWPSGRSWDTAIHALTGSILFGFSPAERDQACAAFIGKAPWNEFTSWLRTADLPSPDDVLSGRVVFHHRPARLDRTVAVLGSCTSMVMSAPEADKKALANDFWRVLDNLTQNAAGALDLCVTTIAQLCSAELFVGNTTAYTVVGRIAPVALNAGIDLRKYTNG